MRVLALLAAPAAATVLLASASAAPQRVLAWPGSAVTYRDLTRRAGYHSTVRAAVAAWNQLQLGVQLVPVHGHADVVIAAGHGRCLLGRAGKAYRGFRSVRSVVRVARSCPAIVRPLLVAHELGRVLGLPNDDSRCSLMNSHAISDGITYVVPAKCSRRHPPSWIRSLVDRWTVDLAHTAYTAPLSAGAIRLSVDAQGVPRVSWEEPEDATAVSTVVVRMPATCPTDRDVATGAATDVYAATAAAGAHSVVDSAFPRAGETDCFRAFRLNAFGRMSASPDAISYTFGGPIAGLTAAGSPTAGSPVTFDDVSSAPRSPVVHWHWDFGDPASATNVVDTSDPARGREVSHVYAAAGTYEAALTVTDGAGRTSSMLQEVVVGAGA